ncbi:hypothetical protein HC023_07755 [Streptomyces sp. NEAU-H3]|nr:hypothetical protein [Streptomyces sp. NEAU-H3]
MSLSRKLLSRRGIDTPSALLVCKPYEERRAYATAQKLWPEVKWRCASSPEGLREYAERIGDPRLVLDMLVGAHQRVLLYPAKGFAVEQHVPTVINAAFERLCHAGFSRPPSS